MKLALFALLVLFTSAVQAQEQAVPKEIVPGKIKPHAPLPVQDKRPVTRDEAIQVFSQSRETMGKALGVPMPAVSGIPAGASPVSREHVVSEFMREYNLLSPKAKLTPLPVSYEARVLKIGPAQKKNLEELIRLGFVAKVGPLATGPTDTLTPMELGDAVGFFICRMAQITHLPDPKWSPMIQNPNG